MAAMAASDFLSHYTELFPAPLNVEKRASRSTFSLKSLRKFNRRRGRSSETSSGFEDLLDQISEDLSVPPISRVPGSEPLVVRKTRVSTTTSNFTFSTVPSSTRNDASRRVSTLSNISMSSTSSMPIISKLSSLFGRDKKRSPTRAVAPDQAAQPNTVQSTIPTLEVSTTILPEISVLESDEPFWVQVQVEGVLHNSMNQSHGSIDVVLLIDNFYYVTANYFRQTMDAASAMINLLDPQDRLAMYATKCTHHDPSGSHSEQLFSMKQMDEEAKKIFRDRAVPELLSYGTQRRSPLRGNPSMEQIVTAIAQSLHESDKGIHFIILSPVVSPLRKAITCLKTSHPNLQIHQVNPGVLPYHKNPITEEEFLSESWSDQIGAYNYLTPEPAKDVLEKILQLAHGRKPCGTVTDLHLRLQPWDGCSILATQGQLKIPHLRPGQVHRVFVQVSVAKDVTTTVPSEGLEPVLASAIRQDRAPGEFLKRAEEAGSELALVLEVEALWHTDLHPRPTYCATHTPLIIIANLSPTVHFSGKKMDRVTIFEGRVYQAVFGLRVGGAMRAFTEVRRSASEVVEEWAKAIPAAFEAELLEQRQAEMDERRVREGRFCEDGRVVQVVSRGW